MACVPGTGCCPTGGAGRDCRLPPMVPGEDADACLTLCPALPGQQQQQRDASTQTDAESEVECFQRALRAEEEAQGRTGVLLHHLLSQGHISVTVALEALERLKELSLHGAEGAAARAVRAALAAGGEQAAPISNATLVGDGEGEGGTPFLPPAGPARSQRLKRSRPADGPPAESVSAHGGAQAAEESPLLPGLRYKERLRWTPELRGTFDAAVEALGGLAFAQPAQILNLLRGEPGGAGGTLTLAHLKSHLQKCRLQAAAPGSAAASRVPGAEAPGLMSGLWQLVAAAPLGEAEAEVEAPAVGSAGRARRDPPARQ